MNIADGVARQASIRPHATAIIDGDRTISYHQLQQLVHMTAAHLLDLGAAPGDRIGLGLKDGADHVIALLAVARMGGVALPVDWCSRPEETARLSGEFSPVFVVVEAGASVHRDVPSVVLDDSWARSLAGAREDWCFPRDRNAPFLINLSSGTTGPPKGAVVTHRQILLRMSQYWVHIASNHGHRYLSAVPLSYSAGRFCCLNHLVGGSTVILYPPLFTAEEYVEAVFRYEATSVWLVPTVLRWLLQLPDRGSPLLPGLQSLLVGGGFMDGAEKREVMRRINANLHDTYATSATGLISVLPPEDIAEKADTVGRPTLLTEVDIVDEAGESVPKGVEGWVRCRGAAISTHYYAGGGGLAVELLTDGWYHPGELGVLDDAGYLQLSGRTANLIIRGGVNINPEEIEMVLLAHPNVAEVAVVGRQSAEFGEDVVAFLVLRHHADVRDLITFCRRKLSAHKVPQEIILANALPKTVAGKVKKFELAQSLNDA